MAARRHRTPPEEWSCPLCTLLNHWRDRRCAACDQEREPQLPATGNDDGADVASQEQQQQVEQERATANRAPVSNGTTLAPAHSLRGVFFSSATQIAASTATAAGSSNWRNEPRLKVNRRKRPLPRIQTSMTQLTTGNAIGDSQSGAESQAPSFSLLGNFGSSGVVVTRGGGDMANAYGDVYSSDTFRERDVRQQVNQPVPHPPLEMPSRPQVTESEEDSMMLEEDESQPCFQLLGPNTAMFPIESTVAATPVDEPRTADNGNTSNIFDVPYQDTTASASPHYAPPSFSLIDVSSSPPTAPPTAAPPPACAQLPPAADYQQQQRTKTGKVPASVLQQGFVAASRAPIALDELAVEDKLAQAGLDLSDSGEDDDDDHRRRNRNKLKLRRNRIASPEPTEEGDEEEEKQEEVIPADNGGGTWECPICTNFNSCTLVRCELCDTKRESDAEDNNDAGANSYNRFIDLANSQEEEKARGVHESPNYYGFDPRDFENPYDQVPPDSPAYEDYGGGADIGGAGYDDYVEDISDHEAPMAYDQPPSVRADLKEFEHFVCVEDLATDYGCRIDYRQMFGESKRGKSFADRIQSRKRASQKRKRAQDANGGVPSAARGKSGPSGFERSKKGRQLAAANRRAAAAGGKPARAPKKRRGASTGGATATSRGKGRRASAPAPAAYTGINHYDTSTADFGDGVSTMAWEGVGSAGYFKTRDGSSGRVPLCIFILMATGCLLRVNSFQPGKQEQQTHTPLIRTMTTLEEAKAFLTQESADGTNLYDHLSDVLFKILVERPENLSDAFECISSSVKQQRYVAPVQSPAAVSESTDVNDKRDILAQIEKWCNQALDLLKIKSEDESSPASGVADLLDEANMFEWVGLGFSKSETFRLSVSLQRLAQTNATTSMRFWGKMLGYGADFYIVEGELSSGQSEPEDLNAEEFGPGSANKFTYWAMKDNGSYEWVQLPNVRREQILIARQLHRFVKSDLEGKVTGHPPFPGVEKHFLRAQIARITAGTVVCPAGYFQVSDASEEIEPADEPEIKTAQDLTDLGSWVHFSKEINARYGRATPLPPQTNADGEEVPYEGEEFAPPLRSLGDDAQSSWRVDRLPETLVPAVGEFAVVRSLVWPGAVGIAVGKKFLNVYVGNGVKFSREPYQLQPPKPVQIGFGISISQEDGADGGEAAAARPVLRFDALVEQKDLLEDPTPPEAEE